MVGVISVELGIVDTVISCTAIESVEEDDTLTDSLCVAAMDNGFDHALPGVLLIVTRRYRDEAVKMMQQLNA